MIRQTEERRHSRHKKWFATTLEEMKAFLAIVINMGLIKKRSISSYWSTRACNATPWFGTVMSRNRFQLLLRYMHVEDVDRIPPRNSPHYK